MRQMAAGVLVAAALAAAGMAQVDKKKLMSDNPQSPPQQATVDIGGKQIWIVYHAPSVRGRHIFGGTGALQPDETVWRAGADWATVMHTDAALDLGGVSVPPGEYTLYVYLDKGKWQLIINKQTGQWGVKNDDSTSLDESQNLGKAAMAMSKPSAPVETFKISLTGSGSRGKLQMAWADVVASVPFTVKM